MTTRKRFFKNVFKEGFLEKQGSMFKTWKMRYFAIIELKGAAKLCYFLCKPDFLEGKALKILPLSRSLDVRDSACPGKRNCFELFCDAYTLLLSCRTEQERDSWMETFQQVLAKSESSAVPKSTDQTQSPPVAVPKKANSQPESPVSSPVLNFHRQPSQQHISVSSLRLTMQLTKKHSFSNNTFAAPQSSTLSSVEIEAIPEELLQYLQDFVKLDGAVFVAKKKDNTEEKVLIRKIPVVNKPAFAMELNCIKCCEHRNLIELNKVITQSDTVWVVEHFVRWSLARALQQRNSPMPELQVAFVAKEILQGLQYLHERFLHNGHINVESVYLDASGAVKIVRPWSRLKAKVATRADRMAAARAVAGSIGRLSQSGTRGNSDPPIPTHLKSQQGTSNSTQQSLQRQITYDIYGLGMLVLQAIQYELPVDTFGLDDALSQVSCSKSLKDFVDLCLNSEKLSGTVDHISIAAHLSKHEFLHKVCPQSEFAVENVPYHRYRINKKLLGILHHRFSPGSSPGSQDSSLSGSSTPYSSSPLSNNNNVEEPFLSIPEDTSTSPRDLLPREMSPRDLSPRELSPQELSPRDTVTQEDVTISELLVPEYIFPVESPFGSPRNLSPRQWSPRSLSPKEQSPNVSPRNTYRVQSKPVPIPSPTEMTSSSQLLSTSPAASPPTILLNDLNLCTGSPNKQT